MDNFKIEVVDLSNPVALKEVEKFLQRFSLTFDRVDYSIVLRDEKQAIIATCSKLFNLIKCVAVCNTYTDQNLSNKMVSYMLEIINQSNYDEAFIITKAEYGRLFRGMGFVFLFENGQIAFLTSRPDKVQDYENYLRSVYQPGINGIIVMNANPFTKGHEYLVTMAAKQVDHLYIVPVLENLSFFTYQERKTMIEAGVKHLKNVQVLAGCPYIISKSVFPSYFLKSSTEVIKEQTNLDANLFVKLFKEPLQVKKRFVGSEPFSKTTEIYNETLQTIMAANQIELVVFPREEFEQQAISASTVRKALLDNNQVVLKNLLPSSTLAFLKTLDLTTRLETDQKKIFKDN